MDPQEFRLVAEGGHEKAAPDPAWKGMGSGAACPLESHGALLNKVRRWWAGYWILAPVRPVG